jgi:hypothetical protein
MTKETLKTALRPSQLALKQEKKNEGKVKLSLS